MVGETDVGAAVVGASVVIGSAVVVCVLSIRMLKTSIKLLNRSFIYTSTYT